MRRPTRSALGLLAALLLSVQAASAQTPAPAQGPASAKPAVTRPRMGLAMPEAVWTGDLDGMIGRRQIRALVPYSKTFYFVDKGQPRGIAYDALATFEDTLNQKLKTKNLRVHVVF